ncbi:MAG TPA: sigma-70 family RNA polymerase sigma factor [Candidatus Saccharimonadales bacterium]|nr:sigma-70 family RNA polymerase sigma factor [Candidatus Saccharimonadales bacterium]
MPDSDLYNTHVRTVYGFFMAKTFHKQLAEDLTSEVFTTAFEQFASPNKQIDDKEKYLYGVMKLVWVQHLRKKYALAETAAENIEDFAVYAAEELQATKERSLIDRALPYIAQLPESQQMVLMLRFRDGLSLKEIASHLGKNMNYVKTTQKRGLASLKRVIQGDAP